MTLSEISACDWLLFGQSLPFDSFASFFLFIVPFVGVMAWMCQALLLPFSFFSAVTALAGVFFVADGPFVFVAFGHLSFIAIAQCLLSSLLCSMLARLFVHAAHVLFMVLVSLPLHFCSACFSAAMRLSLLCSCSSLS